MIHGLFERRTIVEPAAAAISAKDTEGARAAMVELIRLAILDMPASKRPKPAIRQR